MPPGRPTVVTEEVLKTLIECFTYAATDEEACETAGISPRTLYEYCKQNPDFSQRKERLKKMTNYTAKKVIVDKIRSGDDKQANWWLERKGKDDGFSQRVEQTGADGKDLPTPILGYVQKDDSNKQDMGVSRESTEQGSENTGGTGGDISLEDNQHSSILDTVSTD